MSRRDEAAALTALPSIPRNEKGPVFPAPWAATAFAMTLVLHQRALFTWPDWAERLGAEIAAQGETNADDPETYWHCWLAALETMIADCGLAASGDLERLQDAWRDAADVTPHGEPIAFSQQVKASLSR